MAEKDFKVKHGLFVTDSANINNLTVRGDASVSGSITVTGNFVGEYAGFDSDFNQKTTTNLTEGDNLYYTTARADSDFDSRLSTKSTNDLTEGDNLYYTSARADSDFDTRLSTKSTDNLTEGDNLYYTTARADSDFDVRLVTKSTDNLTEGDNLYYTTARADSDFDVRLATKSTDNLTEGDNLYYTTSRADSDFDTRLSTKSTDDLTEGDNLYYTTARADSDAKNAVSVTDAGGDGSISYNNATGTITYTGPSATETRAHLVAGTGVNYDSANGVVSIGQSVGTSDTVTFTTVNTGQGANELYAMDQNVRTTDNVAFGQIDGDSATMGQINFKTDWVTDHITFSEGAVWYDPYHKNLNYYTDIDHPIEIGMQMVERVYNDTGSTILKGKPLYYSGNRVDTAGLESPTVALANATSATKYNVQGLAGEDIANGAYGLAVVAGVIDGFDTSGLNAGANFFVGLEDGAVQNAAPSYPNYPMCLGWVIQSDASDGKVIINQQNHSVNTFRVQGDTHIGDDLVVDGNLTVKGTQTITSTENVSIGGNFQYLNAGNTIGEAGTVFVGTGLDDAFFAGHYSGDSSSKSFFVKIDATGTPDTFEWGFDSDVGTEATGIAITSNEQLLDSDYGISINFGTTTGHTIGDKWTGSATALDTDTGFFSNKNEGDAGNGYTHIGVYWDASQNEWTFVGAYDPEPEAPINRSDGSFAYGDIRAKDIYATNVTGTFIGSASQLGGLTSSQFLRSDTADTKTSGDLSFSDNVKAIFGAGSDLQIYHDVNDKIVSSSSYMILEGSNIILRNNGGTEDYAKFFGNGAVTLFHNNAAKLDTTSTGVDITGDVTIPDGSASANRLVLGDGDDAKFFHNGVDTYWMNETGNIVLRNLSDDKDILLQSDDGSGGYATYFAVDGSSGQAQMYYYGSLKLNTNTSGIAVTGNATFADNGKAIFGAGSDLQIYHDGSNSRIQDTATGSLILAGTNFYVNNTGDSKSYLAGLDGGSTPYVRLYYDGATRLDTTSTGVDITGTLTSDGLTVDGDAVFTTGDTIRLNTTDGSDNGVLAVSGGGANSDARGARVRLYGNEHASLGGALDIGAGNVSSGHIYNYTGAKLRQKIDYNGDISFYEDTGTTAKFFWDASAERLGLTGDDFQFYIKQGSNQHWYHRAISNGKYAIHLNGTGDIMTLDTSGKVGIGTDAPSKQLEVTGDLQLDADNASIWLKSGAVGTNGRINWTYNTDDTVYASAGLNYDTRASTGFHLDVGYPITLDTSSSTGIKFITDTAQRAVINNSGLSVTGNIAVSGTVDGVDIAARDSVLTSTTTTANAALPKAGGTMTGNLAINSGSPELYFGTTGNHYNWRIAAQEAVDAAFEISVGSQDTDYSNDTYTPKFVVKSSGNVGIGLTAPEARLHIAGGHVLLNNALEIRAKDTGGTARTITRVNSSDELEFGWSAGGPVKFMGGSAYTERMRIHTNGNIGIGVTDPIYPLEVQGEAGIELYNGSGGGSVLNFRPSLGDANKYNMSISSYDHSGGGVGPADGLSINGYDGISFSTGSQTARQERMRIDASGNLLVATTDAVVWNNAADSAADNGHNLRDDGRAGFSSYQGVAGSNATVNVNRTGTDGDHIRLFKSGALVGSIGANGGDVYIGTGDTGVRFVDSLDCLLPLNTSTNATRDAAIDIGYNDGGRFKDLYLSGGVVLDEAYNTTVTATTATTSQTAIATFAAATYGSAEVLIQAKDGSNRHLTKLLITHNGTTAIATEYGTVVTSSNLATYEVDINSGNVRVLATPASTNSTVFKMTLELIEV